ncbi:MAG: Ig-like domain-containing protein [Thermoguttaceae bacterium]
MNRWPMGLQRRRLQCETLEDRLLLSVTMTDYEQLMFYYVNRARIDPAAEAARLGVGLNDGLPAGTISSDPKQPLVPNQALSNAAVGHSLDMLARDFFAHDNPDGKDYVDRASAAGYPTSYVWENISWEGSTGTLDRDSQVVRRYESLFRSPSHRKNYFHDLYQDLGIGMRFGEFTEAGATYNAAMVTQNFGRRNADTYLVGVVFDDANGNAVYDLHEGIADVAVQVGDQSVLTTGSGGWTLQVPSGTHTIVVGGAPFGGTATSTVTVGKQNVEVDFLSGQSWGIVNFDNSPPPQGVEDRYFAEGDQILTVPAGAGPLANDIDWLQSGLSIELVDGPQHGVLRVEADGAFSYEPAVGFRGIDTFTYRARADQEISDLTTVSLIVGQSLGTVDFERLAQLDLSSGSQWYRLETVRPGLLTVEASGGTGNLVALYDLMLDPVAASQDSARIDLPVDGAETFYLGLSGTGQDTELRIANLVATSGTDVLVSGTDGADAFEFERTESSTIRINGVGYEFDPTRYKTIVFNGGAGADSARFTGGAGTEVARLFPGEGTFGGSGLLVTVNDVSAITARSGGGSDEAYLYDSPGGDTFVSRKGYGKLSGQGFLLETFDFMFNYGYATTRNGGRDTALMEDTPGADKFKFDWPSSGQFFGKMYGGGVYYNRAKNFEQIDAVMSDGKNMARLFDSEGDDTLRGQKDASRMSGAGYDVTVSGYDSLIAYASAGNDVARLEDSAEDDGVRARWHKVVLWGGADTDPTYEITARKFDEYHFEASSGGYDQAKLHDTALADHVHAVGDSASLYQNGAQADLLYEVAGFEWIRLYATDNENQDTLKKEEPLDFDLVYDPALWEEVP